MLTIDYNRQDMARRMRLLELVAGNLERAKELEQWVLIGNMIDVAQREQASPINPIAAFYGCAQSI